jgi:hypothetical protein
MSEVSDPCDDPLVWLQIPNHVMAVRVLPAADSDALDNTWFRMPPLPGSERMHVMFRLTATVDYL